MGAQASTAAAASDADADAFRRAWREGVPFTQLHDEAFVAEKYQEVRADAAGGSSSSAAEVDAPPLVSGCDGVSMDELQHAADRARMRLFSKHRTPLATQRARTAAAAASAASLPGSGNGYSGASSSSPLSTTQLPESDADASALATDAILSRESAESVAAEQLRKQRIEIAEHYFAQLAGRLGAHDARPDDASCADAIGEKLSLSVEPGATYLATWNGSPSGVFAVSSFRVQLEMLREFRASMPRLFESSVLAIVQTLLDFPPFALRGSTTPEQALISDAHVFCRDILDVCASDASGRFESQRRAALLLLLALGVSSGRASLLLDFVDQLLCGQALPDGPSKHVLQGRSFASWVDALLARLESYRVEVFLGVFEDGTLGKQFPVKLIQQNENGQAEGEKLPSTEALTTDGTFVYTWSMKTGLLKIGSGMDFTIAGRVYAECSARVYTECFQRQRAVRAALTGFGRDVTEVVRGSLAQLEPRMRRTICETLATSGSDGILSAYTARRLFVVFSVDGAEQMRIFGDDDDFELLCASLEGDEATLSAAFYGDFEVLDDESVELLQGKFRTAATSTQKSENDDSCASLTVSLQLLDELLPVSRRSREISSSTELILFYAIGGEDEIVCNNFRIGDQICGLEDRHSDVYLSSMVLCSDSLYLSLLCTGSDRLNPENPKPEPKRKSRRLIRVSPQDLSVMSVHPLRGDTPSALPPTSKPLVVYVTEGARVYEVEMSASVFDVRVFSPMIRSSGSLEFEFARSFTINVDSVQNPYFVSYFLSLLSFELSPADGEIDLPVLYTNGKWLGIVVPASSDKAHIVMVDCDTGVFIEDKSDAARDVRQSSRSGLPKYYEIVVPGRLICFDAKNNLLWTLDSNKGLLTNFRNPDSAISGPVEIPFVADLQQTSFTALLKLTARFTALFQDDEATAVHSYCLQASLSVLDASVNLLLMKSGKSSAGIVKMLRDDLSPLLNGLIHSSRERRPSTISEQQMQSVVAREEQKERFKLDVISKALDLYATCTRIFHPDVENQFEGVLQHLKAWKSGSVAVGLEKQKLARIFDRLSEDQVLRKGFFGVLSPMLISSGLVFLSARERFREPESAPLGLSRRSDVLIEFLKEGAQKMASLLRSVEAVSTALNLGAQERAVESVIVDYKMETMESAHEYANSYDDFKELRIAGATKIVVTFDPKSRTELNYDYVTFFKDRTKRDFYGIPQYSGRDSEYTWPGVGSNPPLVIESDHCFVAFHTDQSNTDWGYRFTAKGEVMKKRTSVKRHWLVFLAESIVRVLDEIMRLFVDGSVFAPISETEFLNERVLQSDLLKGGISAEQSQNTSVLELLKAFADPPDGSRAEKVVNALKDRSGGRRQPSAASSFADASESNANKDINSAVRAVAAAILHHNMWGMDAFAFAEDLRSDVSDQLLRGWKNAQKMRDWFHLGDAADAGMQRPATPSRRRSRKLRRQPSAFKGISEESLQILCEKVTERARFLLDLTPASFSYVSGAKRRWGLLAKYGHAIGKMGSTESAIDKWYNLLDELQVATELRSLFQYRRNSSERMRGGQVKSVTEQVLAFIQSELKTGLVESFASTMKKLAQTYTFTNGSSQPAPARIHFATKLSGSLIVAILKACALDYDVEDSYLLQESRILAQVLRDSSDEAESEKVSGVVTAIVDVTKVEGSKNLVKDTAFASPWSSFGLFLSDQRQLSYKIACGGDRECVYNSNYELDANEWSHVAVAQDGEALRIFVNGILASQHVLDPFLLMHGNASASEAKIVESAHPYQDTVDQYWPVHIPGAVKIRVTFDPLSDIDQSTGYVRFYKNARCNEYWGEEKYSGKYHDPERNFPGAQSQRYRARRNSGAGLSSGSTNSVEIPSDRFVVYFHNDGNSNGWGYRLLAVPEFPSTATNPVGGQSLNPFPFYFGEPPSRVLDEPAAKCSIFEPKVCAFAASESDIAAEIQTTSPAAEQPPSAFPIDRALHILSLLQMCSETPFGRSLIGTPENLGYLLVLALDDRVPVTLRCAGVAVLRELAEFLSPAIATVQLQRLLPQLKLGLVGHLFEQISDLLNVWRLYADEEAAREEVASDHRTDAAEPVALELRASAQEAVSLVSGYISLLRLLAGHFDWSEVVFSLISESLSDTKSFGAVPSDPKSVGHALASCALLGGTFDGVMIGGRVTCCVNIDGKETVETGYLLEFRVKNGTRVARVLFDCDRTRPIDVPASDIAHLDDEELEELQLFQEHMSPFVAEIKALFTGVLELDVGALLSELEYNPKVTQKENVEVLESEHPYCNGEDVMYPLDFGEAKEIVIYFDKASCTAGPNDYVSFFKRTGAAGSAKSNRSRQHWGEQKYYGDHFPGLGNVPPLRIPASSVDVHFHTDASASRDPIEWGFKLTAHAFTDTLSFPPEIPPSATASALCDIRARCVKATSSFLRLHKHAESLPDLASLVPSLTKIANEPSAGRPTCSTPRSQVFESKHPYSSSVLEYMEVVFRGASKLTVTFDAQSRTELNCDYLSFFKDRSLTEHWGANQYSGDGTSANWPGVNGRPPLVIPSDSFTLFWCTDVSNVDWGWKFTVTAEFKPVLPLSLSLEQLEARAYHMFEMMHEKLKPQRSPSPVEFDCFEKVVGDGESAAHRWRNDPMYRFVSTDLFAVPFDSSSASSLKLQQFVVVDKAGASVYSDQRGDEVLRVLESGERFQAVSGSHGWLEIVSTEYTRADERGGWVRQRTDDQIHVASLDGLTRHENLLVLGVDDSRVEAHRLALEMSECNEEQEALANFSSQFALEPLKGQCDRFQSFAFDTHRALATKCARSAIADLLSSSASVGTIKLEDFRDEKQFLALLSHIFADERGGAAGDTDSGKLALFASRMRQFVNDTQNAEFLERSIDRCLFLLRQGATLLPVERGALRVIESEHPHNAHTDQHWRVSIPGASKIVVTCDARSKCEGGKAWLRFYKDGSDRSETHGEPEYGGSGDNAIWPGCGGRPPLVVEADAFEAHFHSEVGQSEWGFKFFAVGMFDDLHPVGTAATARDVDAKSAMQVVTVCCWLLEVLSAELSRKEHALCDALYSSRMLETVLCCLDALPQLLKPRLLLVVTNLAQNSGRFHRMPHHLVERVRDFVNVKMGVRYKVEEASESKSHFLQMLVQCAVSIDLAIESGSADAYRSGGLHQYQLLVKDVTAPFSAVIWAKVQHSERASKFVEWSDDGSVSVFDTKKNDRVKLARFASSIRSGDAISFQLDFGQRLLVLRKNGLGVGVLAASEFESLGGAADWTALSMSSFAERSLGIGAITAGSQDEILGWAVSASPLALLPASVAPTWYSKLVDSVATALAFRGHGAVDVAVRESAHPLQMDDQPDAESDEIVFPGAVALEVKFDRRSKLPPQDTLDVRWRSANALDSEVQSISFAGLNGEEDRAKSPLLFMSDGHKRRNDLARVGDLVVTLQGAESPTPAQPHASHASGVWGYRFFVIPHYSMESIGHERFQEPLARLGEAGVRMQLRHDKHLVKYVNHVAQAKHLSASMVLRVLWSDIAPSTDELVRWPVLLEIATGTCRDPASTLEQPDVANVEGVTQENLAKRFKVLQDFNAAIHRLLPYVSFGAATAADGVSSSPTQLFSELVSMQRHRIFSPVKRVVWDDALERTAQTSVALELTLNRPKAMRHRSSGKADTDARYALFSQAFRQLNSLGGAHYRRADNFYHVVFLGENAQDAGGPYRETLAQYCEELQSPQLPLLLPSSNSQHNVGVGREKWVVNPGASSATMLHMFEFLGKLMGVVLRSKDNLPLNLASLIWKKLVGEECHIDDLAAIDSMVVNSMHKVRTIDACGVTEEMFEDIVLEVFTTLSSDNRVVPLKPDGQSIAVTFANRCEYADLVERYRFREFDQQVAALLRGISTVVPAKLLSCFTGPELELMVCGTPEVDVDLLERCTEYSSCSASDEHVVWFWQALRAFSHDERSAFLRFVWGRSRLPANEKEFPQLFKLQSFSKAQPGRSVDGYLPIAHTCFFSVELPRYSSDHVLRDKLLYAIYNCQEIDGDGDSVAANQLGWEE
ncbi:hypothetical protein PybrP1_007755 [[Pythium] brassicae (nom. inval.)]|nr:hypothetical protein PybrP1_007755 [[Pythium] brassicae (nom. inval.)]